MALLQTKIDPGLSNNSGLLLKAVSIKSILDKLSVDQVVLVGQSLGGFLAQLCPFLWMKKAMAKQVSTTQKSYENIM